MSEKLKTMFMKFIDEYADELDTANATKNYKRPFGDFVRKDIVSALRENISDPNYLVKGSVGVGYWTNVPWNGDSVRRNPLWVNSADANTCAYIELRNRRS